MYPPPLPLLITALIYHERNYHTHTYAQTNIHKSKKSQVPMRKRSLFLIYFLLFAVVQTPGRESSWSAYMWRGRVCPTKRLQSNNHACLNEVWRVTGGCIFIVMNSENPWCRTDVPLSVCVRVYLLTQDVLDRTFKKMKVSQIKDMM